MGEGCPQGLNEAFVDGIEPDMEIATNEDAKVGEGGGDTWSLPRRGEEGGRRMIDEKC